MRLRGYPTFRQTPMAGYMTTIDSSSTGLYSTCAWVTWVNYFEPTPEVVQLLCSKHLVPLKFIRTYILFRIDPQNSWGRPVIDQNDDPFQLGELQTAPFCALSRLEGARRSLQPPWSPLEMAAGSTGLIFFCWTTPGSALGF